MRSEVQKVAWRAYWPVTLLAVTFLLVVGIFGTYVNTRQQVANDRAERQRKAICAILANIPGHIPAEIASARIVFARRGHPGDCLPIVRPTSKPTPAPTVTVAPSAGQTIIIIRPERTSTPEAAPPPSRAPSPRPSRTPAPQPTPTPSPARTCVLIICT